jgi:hypothetical protein
VHCKEQRGLGLSITEVLQGLNVHVLLYAVAGVAARQVVDSRGHLGVGPGHGPGIHPGVTLCVVR